MAVGTGYTVERTHLNTNPTFLYHLQDSNGPFGLVQAGCPSPTPRLAYSSPTSPAVKIASGNDHVVLLTNTSAILTFGCAEQGQLGRVPEVFSTRGGRKGIQLLLEPQLVRFRKSRNFPAPKFLDVFCGSYHTFAVTEDEAVYVWGLNNYGQLGTNDTDSRFQPERLPQDWVPRDHDATDSAKENRRGGSGHASTSAGGAGQQYQGLVISGGQHHTVMCNGGCVYVMGRREYGRLGLGENTAEEPVTPRRLPRLQDIVDVVTGSCCSFALSRSGEVSSWGMGTNLQLGMGEETDLWTPTKISAKKLEGRKVVGLSAGGQHTALLVLTPQQKTKK